MSALRHGFFRRGFMFCDRCVLGAKCESFVPGGECAVEKQAYDGLVAELMREYGLEGLADEILVRRLAMYLIRVARVEVYEANVGVSDASAVLGRYIVGLDNMLRNLLRDLALTRSERKKAEKGDVLVDVDMLLNSLAKRENAEARAVRARCFPLYRYVLKDWVVERRRLLATDERRRK